MAAGYNTDASDAIIEGNSRRDRRLTYKRDSGA